MSSFLKKLAPFVRKPSLSHAKPEVRLQALAELNLTEADKQSSFLTWFTNENHQPTLEAGLALLCKTSQQEEELQKLAATNQQLNLALIKFAPSSNLAFNCLNTLEADENLWLDLAKNSKTTQLRQAAAEKLTSTSALEDLAKTINNDKSLQRYARQQLEAIKAKQQAEAAQQEAIEEVLSQLTSLTNASDKQLFSAKLQHLTNKWAEVALAATPENLASYEKLINLAKQQEAELLAEEAKLEAEKIRLAELEAAKQAELAEQKRQAELAKEAEQQAKQKQQQALAQQAIKPVETTKAEQQQLEQKVKQLTKDINQLEELVSKGQVQAATRLNAKLNQEITSQLEAKIKPKSLQKLRQLTAQLQELNSWQGFAAAPKRQELLEQMQALAEDAGMQPQIKADKIQQLQHQWRELGSAAANKEIWLAFKQAADAAFEPCKVWFAEQNEVKNYNQQQKQIICAELESLTANQQHLELSETDLDKLLQEAHNEWHRFNPVSRGEGKKLAQRFQLAIQPLKDQLYALRQVNIDAKRQLIAKAEALLAEENLNQAIETSKQLQESWREVGRAPGSLEPRLWKEFRAACDALFNKRAEKNLAKLEASEATYQQALNELSQAEAALAANNFAQAEKYLAASYSQGLIQKHLRLLANRQQEIKTALAAAKNLAAKEKAASKFNQLLAGFADTANQPDEAVLKLVQLQILTQQPSSKENQQLRLELQIEQMNQGVSSLTNKQIEEELKQGIEELNALGLGQQSEAYQQLKQLLANFL